VPLPTVWKITSQQMTCVRKATNGKWRLVSMLCLKPWTTVPLKEKDHVTYKN